VAGGAAGTGNGGGSADGHGGERAPEGQLLGAVSLMRGWGGWRGGLAGWRGRWLGTWQSASERTASRAIDQGGQR
jgi:hypothetical protein